MDTNTDISSAKPPFNYSELQGLLKELIDTQDLSTISSLIDKALTLLHQLPTANTVCTSQAQMNQIHGMGISLWNKAVTLKSAAAISLNINAQLRHVASTTILLCNPREEPSVQITKKYISMGLKTGRAWLDCDNPVMADTSLQLALQYWNRMIAKYPVEVESADTLKLLFKIYCSQSEAALGNLNEDQAIELIRKAKDLLKTLAKEAVYLSMLCYNYGLQQFKCGKYSNAVTWLKESYEIGRSCTTDTGIAVKQARTLRLLATSYLEWDCQVHWQKALNAIGLANSEHSHPAGLLLKGRILLQFVPNMDDRVTTAIQDTLNHPDSSIDINITAIRETYKHNHRELAIDLLHTLKQKTVISSDREKLEQLHLELLLESNLVEEAKKLVESHIKNCLGAAGSDGVISNTQTSQHFHVLLWDQAFKAHENKNYQLAIQWYQYSLVLLNKGASSPNQNTAKLQRNCCTCYIELNEYEKAEEMAEHALVNDPQSAHSHFLLFKIAVMSNQEGKALNAIQRMIECSNGNEDVPGLLGLAAQMAFEKNKRSIAIKALECIARNPQDSKHALTSLRCLIRLKLTELTPDTAHEHNLPLLRSVLQYISMARGHVTVLDEPTKALEAVWFMKIAWNTGLQAGTAFQEMSESFDLCREFSSFLPNDQTNYSRQRTCLLLTSAALLQAARSTDQGTEKTRLMETVLAKTKECQEISLLCSQALPSDPAPSLLLLYQLEAQLYLGIMSPDNGLMDQILSLPRVEPKLYESVAALIIQCPPREGGALLAQKALQTAVKLHTQSEQINQERLSRCTHSLIQLLMGSEGSSDMVGKEQAFTVLKSIVQLMEEKGGFPEMEMVWHMVKAWNTGIHLYSMLKYKLAETWCSLAMKFLPLLPQDLSKTYQTQMTNVYNELMEKLDTVQTTESQDSF